MCKIKIVICETKINNRKYFVNLRTFPLHSLFDGISFFITIYNIKETLLIYIYTIIYVGSCIWDEDLKFDLIIYQIFNVWAGLARSEFLYQDVNTNSSMYICNFCQRKLNWTFSTFIYLSNKPLKYIFFKFRPGQAGTGRNYFSNFWQCWDGILFFWKIYMKPII